MKKLARKSHKVFIVSIITTILVLFTLSLVLVRSNSKDEGKSPDFNSPVIQSHYSAKGKFQVGHRKIIFNNKKPLEIMIWYPGLTAGAEDANSYDYEVKMKKPLDILSIASYDGNSVSDTPYDQTSAPYPLVILSPGFSIGTAAYGWLAEHLASHGFVAIAIEHSEILDPEVDLWRALINRPYDVSKVLDYMEEQTGDRGSFQEMINLDSIAVIGHSFGGYTALATAGARIDTPSFYEYCEGIMASESQKNWLCEKLLPHISDMANLAGLNEIPKGLWPTQADTRIDAIVSMAGNAFFFGQQGLSEITIPVMAIGGTADADSPYLFGTYPTYEYVSSETRIRIALEDAEHMIFTGPCEKTPWHLKTISGEFCSDKTWDRTYAHELVKHFATTFLLSELKKDDTAAAALKQDEFNLHNIDH